MRPLLLAVGAVSLLVPLTAAPAVAAVTCGTTADVEQWRTDLATDTVLGTTVRLPGCPDGQTVVLKLLTADSDAVLVGPVEALVTAERADFDLRAQRPRIGPITAARLEVRQPVVGGPGPVGGLGDGSEGDLGTDGLARGDDGELPFTGSHPVEITAAAALLLLAGGATAAVGRRRRAANDIA